MGRRYRKVFFREHQSHSTAECFLEHFQETVINIRLLSCQAFLLFLLFSSVADELPPLSNSNPEANLFSGNEHNLL